ncbi:hypothetical protein [Deinococcus misasensis]|uniref:hypothetical protein n=1 Tax=Deinococcus misasensis TaxID=392413 RepID=UPI00055027A0|nr:hypothetical protein [Deinococcus misasensis]
MVLLLTVMFWVYCVVLCWGVLHDVLHSGRRVVFASESLEAKAAAEHVLWGLLVVALVLPMYHLAFLGFRKFGLPEGLFWVVLGLNLYLTLVNLMRVHWFGLLSRPMVHVGLGSTALFFHSPGAAAFAVLGLFFEFHGLMVLRGG